MPVIASGTSEGGEDSGEDSGGGDDNAGDNGGGGGNEPEPEPEPDPDPGFVGDPIDPCEENPAAEGCTPEPPTNPCIEDPTGRCIQPPPPNLDCRDISARNFKVVGSDPHGFDGDNDGIGCEDGSGNGGDGEVMAIIMPVVPLPQTNVKDRPIVLEEL